MEQVRATEIVQKFQSFNIVTINSFSHAPLRFTMSALLIAVTIALSHLTRHVSCTQFDTLLHCRTS